MSTEIDKITKSILKYGPDILEHCVIADNVDNYLNRLEAEFLNYPKPKKTVDSTNWFMPNNYKEMDIKKYVLDLCKTQEELDRVNIELVEYEKRNLIMLLKQMKYIVDTLRKHNIVWGVGRGSSVASYVLHLLGVHKIDSIKYDIPLNEFFKGENNG
jgi:DNA polymerase III alpha subunit